jgi:hypothetical protein
MNYKEEKWYNDIVDRLKENKDMDEDDMHNIMHEEIDSMVIYNSESQRIVDDLNYDVFQEHEIFGRADNISQAAYAALYDLFEEGDFTYEDYSKSQEA